MFIGNKNKVNWCLFSLWSIITLTLIYHHAFWMDEVINLIFGIGVDSHYGIHGNGHPALWFLLLRLLFSIFHKVWVLPLASFLVAVIAVWLLLFKSPFSIQFKILFLCSNFAIYEYVVMARNYGISMLFMFVLSYIVTKDKFSKKLTGPCLFILCNTNIHSVFISISYLLGLIWKSIKDKTIRLKETRNFLIKTFFFTAIGALSCFYTIFPTFDTAATKNLNQILNIHNLGNSFLIAVPFKKITYYPYFGHEEKSKIQVVKKIYSEPGNEAIYPLLIDNHKCIDEFQSKKYTNECIFHGKEKIKIKIVSIFMKFSIIIFSFLIYASVFSLYGESDLFLSSVISLFLLDTFFCFIYNGGYRHQALWLTFMIALLWVSKKNNLVFDDRTQKIRSFGYKAFISLMLLQIWPSLNNAYNEIFSKPSSNSKNLSQFIENNNYIKNSVIISNNDLLLEAIHYYSDTPSFIMSERKFTLTFPFAKSNYSNYSLDDILNAANIIAFCNHSSVLIILANDFAHNQRVMPEKITHPTLYRYDYLNFYIDPPQLSRLQKQARKIAIFEEALLEPGFSVYELSPQDAQHQDSCPTQYIINRKVFDLENGR